MAKIVGLDLGSVTCGIAASDPSEFIAGGVKTLRFESENYDQCLAMVLQEMQQLKSTTAVLGLPKHMNGDIGIRGQVSLDFKEKLEANGIKVILWDERLTTVSAERMLINANVSRGKRKKVIDKMAAVTILQDYLDSRK